MENKIKSFLESKEIKEKARKLVAAAKKSESDKSREGLEHFEFKDIGIKAVANTYKSLAESFMSLVKANNTFTAIKSSQISPDGQLGGKGYIKPIKEIRSDITSALNIMSELLDTFHDEVNSPFWKKTTVEDNPLVKDILSDADNILDKAEEEEKKEVEVKEGGNSPQLSDTEKEKVQAILKSKNWM